MLLPSLLILSLIASFIGTDISVPSFPDISNYFGVSDAMVQLTITYNFLGFCASGLIFGPLSECYGRKKIIIIGNTLLLLGAIGCVFAPSIYWLLIFRFIQGTGSSTFVIAFAIASDSYQGKEAVKLMGMMNAILTITLAIAPTIGSFINQIVGWRGNYISVVILCFISWVLLLLMLPETKKHLESFSLTKIVKDYCKLLSNPKFISLSLITSCISAGYMSFVACSSFLYTKTFSVSNSTYAFNQGVILISFSFASLFCSKILQKLRAIWCIVQGIVTCFISCLLLVISSIIAPYSHYPITISMIIFSIGCGTCQSLIFNLAINAFPKIKGTASSLVSFIRSSMIGIFTWITSYFYNGMPISVALIILSTIIIEFVFTIYLLCSNQLTEY